MRRIQTDFEFTTVLSKMTESETIQAETDNGVTHTITDTETTVKCSGNIDDSKVMKITDVVVKNNIVTPHNNELNVDSKNNDKSEQNNELNTTEIAQLNGIENNVQKKEGYCENNHVDELIIKVSEVNEKENCVHITQTESSTENIEQMNIKTTADRDTITEATSVGKENGNDNLDCNYGATMQTEDIEQFNTKTAADMDTIAESTSEDKEKENRNLNFNDAISIQTEAIEDIEQFNTKTTADIDTVTESTPVDKEKGNNVVMGDMDSDLDSEKNHIMDDNYSNADNVDNDATKTVDILQPKIDAIEDTDNAINEDDILTVKDSKLEDNGNSNDTITVDNEYLSIKRTEDDSEDNFDKDDMAALVYSNSESEDANDHASSECESISNADDKILYENEDSGNSMEVTETAISASVTEANSRLTDSPVTTVLEDDLMEVSDTAICATVPEADNDSPIVTVLQDDSMEVTVTAISASATEADNHSSITTVLIEDADDVKDLFINENLPDDVQELKHTTVKMGSNIDTDCMKIDNESKVVPDHSSKLADCNDITEGDNKHLSTVHTGESTPLQEEPAFNLGTKSHNDKTEETNCKYTEKVADIHKQSDKNVDFNSKEEDNNKPNALENVSDIDCIDENDANLLREKHAVIQEPSDNNTNKFCSDEKIDHTYTEKEPSEGKNVTDFSENPLIINKSVIPDTSTQQVKNIIIKKKDIASASCLANTLDILSDDEDEQVQNLKNNEIAEKPPFHLEDDDDIMLIDDDSSSKECEKDDNFAKQEIEKQSEDTLSKDISTKCKSDTTSISDDKESESDKSILMSILRTSDGE